MREGVCQQAVPAPSRGASRLKRGFVELDEVIQEHAQSQAAVWTTIFPLPAASEPRPGTLQGRELVPFACACTGCIGHARPPHSRIRLGPHPAGRPGAPRCIERLEPCWASARALKELRATSAGRSSSSGRTGHGRQTCGGICGVWSSWMAPESKKDSRAPIGWTSGTRSLLAMRAQHRRFCDRRLLFSSLVPSVQALGLAPATLVARSSCGNRFIEYW